MGRLYLVALLPRNGYFGTKPTVVVQLVYAGFEHAYCNFLFHISKKAASKILWDSLKRDVAETKFHLDFYHSKLIAY